MPALGYLFDIRMMESAPGTGRGCSKTELTMVNSAVLAPMQMASVSTTIAAKRQSLRTDLTPYLKSFSRELILNGGLIGRRKRLPHYNILSRWILRISSMIRSKTRFTASGLSGPWLLVVTLLNT